MVPLPVLQSRKVMSGVAIKAAMKAGPISAKIDAGRAATAGALPTVPLMEKPGFGEKIRVHTS